MAVPFDSTHENAWAGYRERLYQGQRCIARKGVRVAAKAGWRSYNTVSVEFLTDANTTLRIESVPAGRFNAGATCTGRRLRWFAGRWIVASS